MKAVIIGATGLVGEKLTHGLLHLEQLESLVIVARKKIDLNHPKIKLVLINNLEEIKSLNEEILGTHYFCCLGTTIKVAGSQENFKKVDYEAVLNFAEIAKKHQAEKFILVTAVASSPESNNFYSKVKGEVEVAVKALDLNSLTIFRPGLLMGERKEKRFAEKLAIQTVSILQKFIPANYISKIATQVDFLVKQMIQESLNTDSKLKIFESEEITHLK